MVVGKGNAMTIPARSDNLGTPRPTPPSDDEKAAMERALANERPSELFERLERENSASRNGASLDRRGARR